MAQRARTIERNQKSLPAGSEAELRDQHDSPLEVEDGMESPARQLQNLLGSEFDSEARDLAHGERWPLIGSIAFIGIASAILWAGIWWAVVALLG